MDKPFAVLIVVIFATAILTGLTIFYVNSLRRIRYEYLRDLERIRQRDWERATEKADAEYDLLSKFKNDRMTTILSAGGFALIIIALAVIISLYAFNFGDRRFSTDPDQWGQMGDYFGGMLNPILAFASFMALLYTIKIQSQELRLTRDELTKSANAQKESSEALKKQVANIEKQSFEDTFFKMLDKLNELAKSTDINEISINRVTDVTIEFGSHSESGFRTDKLALWGKFRGRLKLYYPSFEQLAGFTELILRFTYTQRPYNAFEVNTFLQDHHSFYLELITTTINKNNLAALVLWCAHNDDYTRLTRFIESANLFSVLDLDYNSCLFDNEVLQVADTGISKRAFSKDM